MCTVCKTDQKQNGGFYVGKNYDAPDPCRCMVFINPPGVDKRALIAPPEIPVKWRAVYGSITCNQVCKDFPCSGMNEAGLIIEQTTLWSTMYPDRDGRPAIKETQWIQYMLDTCATTQEVIAQSKQVRICQEAARLQYFICDAAGDVCIIAFILGEMVLVQGGDLPYPVIANDLYTTSMDYLAIHEGYGGKRKLAKSDMSLDRFAVTVDAIAQGGYESEVRCFSTLDLSTFELTQWSIVYDPVNRVVSYRSKHSPAVTRIDLSVFDFAALSQPLVRELDGGKDFSVFTVAKNRALIKFFFEESKYFTDIKVSERDMDMLARW